MKPIPRIPLLRAIARLSAIRLQIWTGIKRTLAIVRAVMLKGVGLETIWPHLLALAVLGTGIMVTTVLILRRRLSAA